MMSGGNLIALTVVIMLSVLAIGCAIIGYSIGQYNPYNKARKTVFRINAEKPKFLCRIKFVNNLVKILTENFRFIVGDAELAYKISFLAVHLYVVSVVLMLVITLSYTRIWYMCALDIIISFFAPLVLVRILLAKLKETLIKQLPKALDELESAFYRTDRLKVALEIAIPNMPEQSRKAFSVLVEDMKQNELDGIEKFKNSFNSPYLDSLAVILSTYVGDGGLSITTHIQHLSSMIRSDIVNSTQTASKLAKYKFLAVVTIISVPIFIFLSGSISKDMYFYYTSTVEGTTLSSTVLLASVVYYLVVELIERL